MIIPHEASLFLRNNNFIPYIPASPEFLSARQAGSLNSALYKDAEAYMYNGILSFGTGIRSVMNQNYGWATVKFYYSVFYLARAMLGSENICIIYDGQKPFTIFVRTGCGLINSKGTTHKLVLDLFRQHFSSHVLLGNSIQAKPPLEWLMEQREVMNYKSAAMPDPNMPMLYEGIVKMTIRQLLNTYLYDDVEAYTFSEHHACLAYPFKFLIHTIDIFNTKKISCRYLKQNLSFIRKLLSDESGSFDFLLKIFQSVIE